MKTKGQLLKAMERVGAGYRLRACDPAMHYVRNHRSYSAEKIGVACRKSHWLLWFLWGRLTPAGRRLLTDRLGARVWPEALAGDRPPFCYFESDAADLDRKVINDCWRAWCRSGGKP